MFVKWKILRYLIEAEKMYPGSYTSVADRAFLQGVHQIKVIKLCQTLATEDELVEWKDGDDLSLQVRITRKGAGFFSLKKQRLIDKGVGFIIGVASTTTAQAIWRIIQSGVSQP